MFFQSFEIQQINVENLNCDISKVTLEACLMEFPNNIPMQKLFFQNAFDKLQGLNMKDTLMHYPYGTDSYEYKKYQDVALKYVSNCMMELNDLQKQLLDLHSSPSL